MFWKELQRINRECEYFKNEINPFSQLLKIEKAKIKLDNTSHLSYKIRKIKINIFKTS